VEDQQPDPGDLTTDVASPRRRRWFGRRRKDVDEGVAVEEVVESDEANPAPKTPVGKAGRGAKPSAEETPADETPVDETPAEAAEDTESDTHSTESNEEDTESGEEETILVPHRPAGRRLIIAAVAAAVLFVGAAGFAGATLQPFLTDRALVHTKFEIARTAADGIATLWTYTPENMEALPDRASKYLGGDFANEYRRYVDAIVAPNKQAQVTNNTQVLGAAVESVTPTEATALVYTNSVATSPVSKNIPSLRYLSYRLTLQRRDAKWLITRMSTITSLDLTPRL
jgi:Mce-associated membrane protein